MAAALDRYGVPCRLIDKAPAPSETSKALAVWCRSLELLSGLGESPGLADVFVRRGVKVVAGSIYAHGERVAHLALTSDESPYGFPLMIPQSESERILGEHLTRRGLTIERSLELVGFESGSDAVTCTLRHADGREERSVTPWLVGCDGAHSTVRHGLGVAFAGSAEPNDWILADVHVAGSLPANEVTVHWHAKGIVAFFPMDLQGSRFRMIADLGESTVARGEPTLAEAQAKVDERVGSGLRLFDPIWLSNFHINERKVADYRKGRVLLAGDAAHIHSPAGGQGMNTGMQDAFNLAWKLALIQQGRGRVEPLLESYSSERSAVGDRVLRDASKFTAIATLRHPIGQWVRNHLAPILTSLPAVHDRIRDEWLELSISYRESPLSAESWPVLGGGLAAGDRLCDAPLTSTADDRVTTLFSVMRTEARHVLLLFPASCERQAIAEATAIATTTGSAFPGLVAPMLVLPPEASSVGADESRKADIPAFADTMRRLHDRLGVRGPTAIVVRPDGYIGFRCQPARPRAVEAYLGRHLLP